jgi:hypothetical protein
MKRVNCLIVAVVCCWLAGCQSPLLIQRTPVVVREASTNYVTVVRTNFVGVTTYLTNYVTVQAAVTNSDGVVTPAVVQPQITAQQRTLPVVTSTVVTNLAPGAAITGAITAAGELAPVPWSSGAAHVLLALLGTGFGVVNEFRRKRAVNEKADLRSTAKVLINGINTAREAAKGLPGYTDAWDDKLLSTLQTAQVLTGTKPIVETLLRDHKDEMKAVG